CSATGAFIMTPLPPYGRKNYKQHGPFALRALLRFVATSDPSATLSPSTAFPVLPVIRPTLLWQFLARMRRASPVAQRTLVTMLSLPPRWRDSAFQFVYTEPCSLRSRPRSSTPRVAISRLPHVRFRYSLVTRNHPFDGFVGRLQSLGFPPPCYPNYGAPTLTPVGLSPTECASLSWTHRPAQHSLTLWPARSRSRLATLSIESSDSFVTSAAVSIATGWNQPVPGRELHPLKSSAFHGALFHQLSNHYLSTVPSNPTRSECSPMDSKTRNDSSGIGSLFS